jgi:hypothetical protein
MHAENLLFARDLVRHGLDQTALDSYRVAESIAWRRWTRICFDLTSDPGERITRCHTAIDIHLH